MDPAQWVGREIDGRYRVESVLGVGGMGTVLRAKHQFTGVPVAIKILHSQFQLDPEVQSRFFAEAQAPNAIGHPAIVKVTDAGRTSEGTLYMAMELLIGRSLRAAVTKRELSPELAKRVIAELLVALGQAHARGFVHRDLKPDNVFLCAPNDEVKLLDFGIAKVLDDVRRRTAAGALLGTPAYMAPEQLADASNVDSRADLWAVGVMLYEMITGRLPLAGTSLNELMIAVAGGNVIPIRQVMPSASPELEQFFARALAVDPRRRFGAAAEMAPAIQALTWGAASAPVLNAGQVATVASQAGRTVASIAPAPSTIIGSPQAPVSPVTTSIAPPRSAKLPLVIGAFALVAIAVGITLALSGGTKTQVAATPDARAADPAPPKPDAAVAVVSPDAGAPLDAGAKPHRDASVVASAPKDAAAAPPEELTCQQRCTQLGQRCGTQLPSCLSDCAGRAAEFVECFDRSMKNCADGAVCGFSKICNGRQPSGSGTCRQVLDCQIGCGADLDCLCNCDQQLAPQLAAVLGRLNACLLRAVGTCGNTPECGQQQCPTQLAACR